MPSITTVHVTCLATRPDGSVIAKALFRFALSAADTENGIIVPREVTATAGLDGIAVAHLWPNSIGAEGTTYRVYVSDPGARHGEFDLGDATVPTVACNLWQILNIGAPPTVDVATLAKLAAQQAAAEAVVSADAAHADRTQADLDAAATAADRVQTGLDRVATGADRVQTGLDAVATAADRVQTGLDRVSTTASAGTATTQAGVATTQAGIATTKAGEAASSAGTTAALLAAFQSVFLGDFASDSAAVAFAGSHSISIVDGVMYQNTVSDKFRIYNGSAWQDYDSSAASSQSAAALSAAAAAASASTASGAAATATGVLADSGFIAVHSDLANIDAVAGSISNVNSVAGDLTNINSVAADKTNIDAVAADLTNINTVAGDHTALVTVAGDHSAILTVASDHTVINTVAGDHAAINTVAGDHAAITTLVADKANVDAVAADLTNVNLVAGSITQVDNVAADLTNINSVAGDLANINTVAADKTNIDLVAGDKTNIDAVAGNLTAINSANANAATATAQAGVATTQAGVATAQATTATAQASLAAGYAASAGSAIQQDISGVTAAALHRSPGTITGMFIYDTTKDSDAGAWTERCQNTSWYNEALNGKWLGACASESAARAVSGAATGDYFQLSTTGLFYKLNATSGTTEVQRGNKAKFPKIAAIVAELISSCCVFTVYDLTEKNCPMWMRFWMDGNDYNYTFLCGGANDTINAIAAVNGAIYIGKSGSSNYYGGLRVANFISDSMTCYVGYYGGIGKSAVRLNQRNANAVGFAPNQGNFALGVITLPQAPGTIPSGSINSIAFTILPDAPIDVATGLQIPTIAVGTNTGLAVIKHDGSIVAMTNNTGNVTFLKFVENGKLFYASDVSAANYTSFFHVNAVPSVATTDYGNYYNPSSLEFYATRSWGGGTPAVRLGLADSYLKRLAFAATSKQTLLMSDSVIPAIYGLTRRPNGKTGGLSLGITNAYNTGHMIGDIRRVYLSDGVVETIGASTELVVNGNAPSSSTGWAQSGSSYAFSGGVITSNATATTDTAWNTGSAYLTAGKMYLMSWNVTASNANYGPILGVTIPGGVYGISGYVGVGGATGPGSIVFISPVSGVFQLWRNAGHTGNVSLSKVSIQEAVYDRSYKMSAALRFGSLVKALSSPSASNQLVSYSGFSAANYLQEPYSADLDFGTGEWVISAWMNIPATLQLTENIWPNSELFGAGSAWYQDGEIVVDNSVTHGGIAYSLLRQPATTNGGNRIYAYQPVAPTNFIPVNLSFYVYKVSGSTDKLYFGAPGGGTFSPYNLFVYDPVSQTVSGTTTTGVVVTVIDANTARISMAPSRANGSAYVTLQVLNIGGTAFGGDTGGVLIGGMQLTTGANLLTYSKTSVNVVPQVINGIMRDYSSGAYFGLGVSSYGILSAVAYDGTTQRIASAGLVPNNGSNYKVDAVYRVDGSLSIYINGALWGATYGNPLNTLNNSNAVLTIGNNYALTAPFPSAGTLALVKLSASAPSPDQIAWAYQQEVEMFRDGANCLLPDSGVVTDLAYDELTDKWVAVSATNESDWTGLVRTNVIAVPAGSNLLVRAGSGVKLNARSTTSPGVDVTIPAWNLREELVKRAEAAAKKAQPVVIFDYSGGFTATTVNGNTAITSVASLTYPAQGSLIGATVTGTGIPASTVIVAISGTTIYLSKACTAGNSAVQIALSDFILPVGYETRAVLAAGAVKQEGSTKDWTRSFDGFREKVTFGTAPGYSAFVEIQAVRSIA